jgi:hypothetical protein
VSNWATFQGKSRILQVATALPDATDNSRIQRIAATMTASGAVRIMRQIGMMRTIVIASVSDRLGGARSKIGPS